VALGHCLFFFSSRRRHTRFSRDWSSDVCSSDLPGVEDIAGQSAWGITVQLYSLRRPGDGGLGDTLALEALARSAAAHGADALGKIGRASCRERVWISVVGVSVKKKTSIQSTRNG